MKLTIMKKWVYLLLISIVSSEFPLHAELHEGSKEEIGLLNAFHAEALRLKNAGRYDEAVDIFKQIIAADPTNPNARFDLGNIYLHQQRYAEAMDFYDQAMKLELDNEYLLTYHFNYSLCYIGLGNNQEAINHLKQCLTIDPGNEDAKNLLELVMNAHGQKLQLQPD